MVLLIKVIQATSNMALRISDFIKSENLVGVSWCCYRRDTGLVMLVAVYLYLICRHLQLYLSRPYLHPFRDPKQMRDMFSHTPLSLLTFDIVLSCESLRSPAGCHLPHCPPVTEDWGHSDVHITRHLQPHTDGAIWMFKIARDSVNHIYIDISGRGF